MRKLLCGIAPLFALLLTASAVMGQVATGVYQYGTFDTPGIDTINVGNLNVHLSIPVLNKAGRGLPFQANLTYDSSIYYPSGVGGYGMWTPVQQFSGWSSNTGLILGTFSYTARGGDDQYEESYWNGFEYINVPVNCYYTTYSNWIFTDASGVSHQLGGSTFQFNGQDWSPDGYTCTESEANNPYGSGRANDGSGLVLNVTNYTQATVTAPNGTATENSNGTATTETDSNGNQISTDGQGNFTDTTGKVVLKVTGNTTSSQVYTYYDTGGTARSVAVNYAQYTVQTNFGCSGIGEYGPTSRYLVSSISFPDGSEYSFTYEPTPGYPSNVTGRLASITVPQGNTINYTYTGGNNGIECTDGSTAGLTRTINSDSGSSASTWTYSRTVTGSGTSQTAVVDGLGNNKVYTFAEPTVQPTGETALYYETTRSAYQGAATGTPVLSLTTCYNAAALPCTAQSTLPISQVDTYQLLNGLKMDGTEATINSSGMTTSSIVYDFGSSSNRGPVLSKEVWTYGYSIPSLVTQDEVFDGSGNEAGNTTYAYDTGTLTASSGVPQHVAVSAARGNLTSITQYANALTPYTTNSTYEDTGSVLTVTAPTGTTTLSYDPTFVYLQGVNLPTPSSGVVISAGESYETSHTGLPLSTTDPNGQSTNFPASKYDSMLRPTEQDNPDGGETSWGYSPTLVVQDTYLSSGVYDQSATQYDGYGRLSRLFTGNGPGRNYYYQQDTCYDANGNVSFVSYRYQGSGSGSSKVCSGAGTTYMHDVLGRLTSVTQSDSETRTTTYSGRATQKVDENSVTRISQVDGLGRTTVVCEISSNGSMPGSGSPTSCGADIAGTGFITNYSYALASGTTTVSQGGQTRTFQNDWLGRPVSTTEPESGTTTYSYAYNLTGLQTTRTRPQANQSNPSTTTTTTTQYDSLGRVLSIGYNDGVTQNKYFAYDANAGWGANYPQNYLKGRLSNTYTSSGYEATMYSYDTMGRTTLLGECTPAFCGGSTPSFVLNYSYDWAGNLLTATDGAGVTTTYTYSPASEVQSITSSLSNSTNPPAILSNVTNGPNGPVSWTLGNGLTGGYSYDSLGRLNAGTVSSGGTQVYSFTAGWKGSQLLSSSDAALGQTASYGYDEFNRLKSRTVTSGTPVTNLSWVYDRWGNRWQQNVTAGSGPQPQYSFNTANNQISGYTYDAAGNQTYDGSHHYTYDAEGNITKVDSGSTAIYIYDALNHRVETTVGSAVTDFAYSASGQRVSEWNASTHTQLKGHYYWGAKPVAYYTTASGGGAAVHFEHQDWLGTERARTAYNGSVEGSYASLPYGDGQTTSGTDTDANHVAMLDFDSESDTDHAQYRQYSPTEGRWLRPDPWAGSYDSSNPQTMNRYVYAMNNPLSETDPSGQGPCDEFGFCFGGPGGSGGSASGGGPIGVTYCVTWAYGSTNGFLVGTDPGPAAPQYTTACTNFVGSGGNPGGGNPGGGNPGGGNPGGAPNNAPQAFPPNKCTGEAAEAIKPLPKPSLSFYDAMDAAYGAAYVGLTTGSWPGAAWGAVTGFFSVSVGRQNAIDYTYTATLNTCEQRSGAPVLTHGH